MRTAPGAPGAPLLAWDSASGLRIRGRPPPGTRVASDLRAMPLPAVPTPLPLPARLDAWLVPLILLAGEHVAVARAGRTRRDLATLS